MKRQVNRHNRPVSGHLHPLVYVAVVGLVLLYVVSAWTFFGAGEYMSLLLAVVTGFFFMAIAIPYAIWLIWRKYRYLDSDATQSDSISLRDWASGELETWQGRRKATDAAVEIVLPVAAVAFGLMAIGIVFHFVAASAVHL
jgi:hypothetical protein